MELNQALSLLEAPDIEIGNGITGLSNLGLTCYLNASVQVLSHTIPFTEYMLNGVYKKYLQHHVKNGVLPETIYLLIEYMTLLYGIWDKPEGNEENISERTFVITPRGLVQIFNKLFPQGGFFRQNDASEAILFLLDTFHDLISREVNYNVNGTPSNDYERMIVKSIDDWAKHFKHQHSYILDVFFGQEHARIQCTNCKKMTDKFPPFKDICLPLNDQTKTIYDCFDYYCRVEQLDKYNTLECDHCKARSQAYTKTTYWKLPSSLIICLKRFQVNPKYNRYEKNTSRVTYPVVGLDLSKYVTNPDENCRYNLYSVICHTGYNNIETGHYYAYCLNRNGRWYNFNDEHISQITNLQDLITQNAYILFYRKADESKN